VFIGVHTCIIEDTYLNGFHSVISAYKLGARRNKFPPDVCSYSQSNVDESGCSEEPFR